MNFLAATRRVMRRDRGKTSPAYNARVRCVDVHVPENPAALVTVELVYHLTPAEALRICGNVYDLKAGVRPLSRVETGHAIAEDLGQLMQAHFEALRDL